MIARLRLEQSRAEATSHFPLVDERPTTQKTLFAGATQALEMSMVRPFGELALTTLLAIE